MELIENESDAAYDFVLPYLDVDKDNTTQWFGRSVFVERSFNNIGSLALDTLHYLNERHGVIVTFSASVDEGTEKDSGTEDTDSEKPYSNKEILTDIAMGVGHSAIAGIEAAGGLVGMPAAIVEITNGSAYFIDAAKKYNENVQFENESKSHEKDDYDRSHDHDSWDKEY